MRHGVVGERASAKSTGGDFSKSDFYGPGSIVALAGRIGLLKPLAGVNGKGLA